jgi:magnesium-transporting ATPase (P-type)
MSAVQPIEGGDVLYVYDGTPAKEDQARTLSFATLVIANIMLIVVNLSGKRSLAKTFNLKNKALWLVVVCTMISLLIILSIPFLQNLFHFFTNICDRFFLSLQLLVSLRFRGLKYLI